MNRGFCFYFTDFFKKFREKCKNLVFSVGLLCRGENSLLLGGEMVKSSTFEEGIQKQFDSLVKRVVRNTVRNYEKQIRRRGKKEIPFSDLPHFDVECMGVLDKYEYDCVSFDVKGATQVKVYNEYLVHALNGLKEKKRNIVLMFYFQDLSDENIAKILDINPSTSFRIRKDSIKEMKKKYMGGKEDEV